MSEYLTELQDLNKELVGFKILYGQGRMKIETQPPEANVCVLMVEYNETANPSFNISGPGTQIDTGDYENYLDEVPDAQGEGGIGDEFIGNWQHNQINPDIVFCGPRKLIITKFDIEGFNKEPTPFCTYTVSESSFVTAASAVSWNGAVIQGTIEYRGTGIGQDPSGSVMPQSVGPGKYSIQDDTTLVNNTGQDYNIEDDIESIAKSSQKHQSRQQRRGSENYSHRKATVQNSNEFLKRLRYITDGGKKIIKRISPSSPKKLEIPPKAVPDHNPKQPLSIKGGYTGPENVNDKGTV